MQKEQEIMLGIIYKALGEGLSKLIKNGLAFTVMSLAIGGLIYFNAYNIRQNSENMAAYKSDFLQYKKEISEEINRLRSELYACDNERKILSIQVAEMKAQINYLKVKN